MKKFYLTLSVVILTSLFIACSEPTKEDLIEKAFKEYVNKNFDDPNDLKEIVSIEVRDTVKNEIFKLVGQIHMLDSLIQKSDSLVIFYFEKTAEQLGDYENKLSDLNYYNRNKIKQLGYEYLECFTKYSMYNKKRIRTIKEEIDSITNETILDMPNIELYAIITRVNTGSDLKLKNYYAISDSINIKIYNEEPAFKDYSKEIGILAEKVEDYFEEQHTFKKLIDDIQKKLDDFKETCRKSGIFIY